MTYLDDATVREQIWRAYSTRGTSEQFDNRQIIARILTLRREKARLVGYRDFADFALADRMAKNCARARQFLADLLEKTEAQFLRENEELRAFRRDVDGTN